MAKTAINIIKGWFKTGMFPTEAQFANWLDSYWHKDDQIAAENIGGLQELLDQKVTAEEGKGLSENDFTDEDKAKLYSANKSGVFFSGAQILEDEDGRTIQVIKTYTTSETREIRLAYSNLDISKIETKDTLQEVATTAVFDNGLPTPTETTVEDYATFTFSIPLP